MKITRAPRTPEQRKRDLLRRLETEMDIWVATADADGVPCLVPLWFVRHGECLWPATRPTTPTGRDLREGRRARPALGDTLDVVLIDGDAEMYGTAEVPDDAAGTFLAKTGRDPRADEAPYVFFRVRPRTVQARNGEHEMRGRFLLRDGARVV